MYQELQNAIDTATRFRTLSKLIESIQKIEDIRRRFTCGIYSWLNKERDYSESLRKL